MAFPQVGVEAVLAGMENFRKGMAEFDAGTKQMIDGSRQVADATEKSAARQEQAAKSIQKVGLAMTAVGAIGLGLAKTLVTTAARTEAAEEIVTQAVNALMGSNQRVSPCHGLIHRPRRSSRVHRPSGQPRPI